MNKKKKLKPSSSYFLTQRFWRILRNFIGRRTWSYLYSVSQILKINSNLKILYNINKNVLPNLNYPKLTKFNRSNKNFSFFLEKHNSSKPHGDYRNFLDQLLKKINVPKTILELGISEGAGILALKDFFKNSYLWGLDIDKNTFIKDRRIVSGYCDQLNLSSIKIILKKFNTKYDLIIDDGWHHPESQINSIIACLPYLNKGGFYLTEDIVHDVYKKYFLKVIKILKNKGFEVKYKKFFVKKDENLAGSISNGYLLIHRNH